MDTTVLIAAVAGAGGAVFGAAVVAFFGWLQSRGALRAAAQLEERKRLAEYDVDVLRQAQKQAVELALLAKKVAYARHFDENAFDEANEALFRFIQQGAFDAARDKLWDRELVCLMNDIVKKVKALEKVIRIAKGRENELEPTNKASRCLENSLLRLNQKIRSRVSGVG